MTEYKFIEFLVIIILRITGSSLRSQVRPGFRQNGQIIFLAGARVSDSELYVKTVQFLHKVHGLLVDIASNKKRLAYFSSGGL